MNGVVLSRTITAIMRDLCSKIDVFVGDPSVGTVSGDGKAKISATYYGRVMASEYDKCAYDWTFVEFE